MIGRVSFIFCSFTAHPGVVEVIAIISNVCKSYFAGSCLDSKSECLTERYFAVTDNPIRLCAIKVPIFNTAIISNDYTEFS